MYWRVSEIHHSVWYNETKDTLGLLTEDGGQFPVLETYWDGSPSDYQLDGYGHPLFNKVVSARVTTLLLMEASGWIYIGDFDEQS